MRENEIQFEEILSEDTIFNLSAYKYASVIAFTDDTDYCYRMEEHPSITKTFSSKNLRDMKILLICWAEWRRKSASSMSNALCV